MDAFPHQEFELFNPGEITPEAVNYLLAKGWKFDGDILYNPTHWRPREDGDDFTQCMYGESGEVCALTEEAREYASANG